MDGLIIHKDVISMPIMTQRRVRGQSYIGEKMYTTEVKVVLT